MHIGERKIERPLRWGMVGGGRTSNVGYKHRLGALRDNTAFQMVCGAFDLDYERGVDFGKNLGVDPERLYPDYKTMFAEEAKREDGIEVVDIATPNFQHYEVAKAALEAGKTIILRSRTGSGNSETCRRKRKTGLRYLWIFRFTVIASDETHGKNRYAWNNQYGRLKIYTWIWM